VLAAWMLEVFFKTDLSRACLSLAVAWMVFWQMPFWAGLTYIIG
jgi:hypothetical protein